MKRRALQVTRGGQTLATVLSEGLRVSASQSEALIRAGAVYVDGRRASKDVPVRAGSAVMVVLEEGGRPARPVMSSGQPLEVLFEDEVLIAVFKPAGVTAQPTPSRVGDSLADLVGRHLGQRAGLVHRLDRETTGVTVFGKTQAATAALAAAFRTGAAAKRYLAAAGLALPDSGTIRLPISVDPTRPGRQRALATANGAPAQTGFRVLARATDHALVALFPRTGRTHQLRAHLAALGAPIAGDLKYGGSALAGGAPATRCLLHAQALRLPHPSRGGLLLLEAPVPGDLQRLFSQVGISPPQGGWADAFEE